MSAVMSVSRRDIFSAAGVLDTSLYSVEVSYDDEIIMSMQIESAEELVALRNALSNYINFYNLDEHHEESQQRK